MLSIFDDFGDQKKLQTTQKDNKNSNHRDLLLFKKKKIDNFRSCSFFESLLGQKQWRKHFFKNLKHF